MALRSGRFLAAVGILILGGLTAWQRSKPAAAPAVSEPDLVPVVTIKELMENIIDPIADNVFDAVATDIGPQGIVDTKPTTDDDWAKVRIAAVTLAEGQSDAYATSQSLWVLSDTGTLPATDPAYRRGLQFLVTTRGKDGSWHVTSRAPKFQQYFESGFPHGHDQWISSAATARAVVVLAGSLQ